MPRLHRLALLGAIAACGQPAPQQPKPPAPSSPAPSRSDADRERDYTAAWAMWTAGNRSEATTAFKRLVQEVRSLPITPGERKVRKGACCETAVSADGTRALVIAFAGYSGLYGFDGAGTLLHYEAGRASTVELLGQ